MGSRGILTLEKICKDAGIETIEEPIEKVVLAKLGK